MKSYSHWGMFHCWEAPGLPPMAEQPKSWMHVPIGVPCLPPLPDGQSYHTPYPTPFAEMLVRLPAYPVTNYTLAEALTPHEDDLKLTITRELK